MDACFQEKGSTLYRADCLEAMRHLPDASVDALITDPPYGTTACSWDSVIPFAPMWVELKRIVKKNGAIVLFGSQPFTSALVMSNPEMFKYQWVWRKSRPTDFVNAKNKPLKAHEDICVFSEGTTANCSDALMIYNPQGLIKVDRHWSRPRKYDSDHALSRPSHSLDRTLEFENYPQSVIEFPNPNDEGLHPTQKPVELLRYLVRTYTNEGDTVLDFTCGSGTTGVACVIERRKFIGIEQDLHYCEVSAARIKRAQGVGCDIPQRVRQYAPSPLFDGALASESVA